ncbi:hypothetical protein [Streptomyces sp. NPDC049881]|uniref:hypothetical protein n=1 Tax=Streptomyces sp. NPDC049881 TaxID=3155778 RepID=UPI00342E74DB
MSLFRRRAGRSSAVPGWCAWFSPDEWDAFRALVEESVRDERGDGVRVEGDQPYARGYTREGQPYMTELAPLAAELRDRPRALWPAALAEVFQRRNAAVAEGLRLLDGPFDTVRHRLLPRVERAGDLPPGTTGRSAARDLGGGLTAVPCLVTDGGTFTVETAHLAHWDVSPDELWALTTHNLHREPCQNNEFGEPGSGCRVLTGTGEWTASHVLRLDELTGGAPHGALVSVPRTDVLLYWAITGADLFTLGPYLQAAGRELLARPGGEERRLTTDLLWWSDGVLEPISIPAMGPGAPHSGTKDDPHVLKVTPRFLEVLKAIGLSRG